MKINPEIIESFIEEILKPTLFVIAVFASAALAAKILNLLFD